MNAPLSVASGRIAREQPYRAPTPRTAGALVTGGARRIGRAIARDLAPQPPTLAAFARSQGMGARSVQRLLKAEGQTYRGVVERVRMDLSERYLRGGEHSLDEVAYLIGYNDTSSFARAFKRCKGQPPRRFAQGTAP